MSHKTGAPWDDVEGEAAACMATVDWGSTPLGPVSTWPSPLRIMVDVLLHSRNPMFLWWGPQLTQLYNDAYVPSFGEGKHPAAMGQAGKDCWQEIWPLISPQIDDVMERRRSSWNEDQLVPVWRNGRIEDVYWTYSYSAVRDADGAVGGTLVVCTETTSRVLSQRRVRLARDLGLAIGAAHNLEELVSAAAGALAAAPEDIPMAVIWHRDAPRTAAAEGPVLADPEMLQGRLHDGALHLTGDALAALGGPRWQRDALVVPLTEPSGRPDGFVVYGLNISLPFDAAYREQLVDLTTQIARAKVRIDLTRGRFAVEHARDNLMLQAPAAAALLMGPRHTFELTNPLYCGIVGRTREQLVGKNFIAALPELKDTALPRILDEVYRSGESFVAKEMLVPLKRRGDATCDDAYLDFNLEPIRDAFGAVVGMMTLAVDVTEQVHARHVIDQTHAHREAVVLELEAASRAKDEFLAMLGHELRNPLAPILTALHLMRLRGEEGNLRERELIERQVTHMVRLVDDLLDVSRITRGKVTLKKEHLELASVIAAAIEVSSPLLEQKRHTLAIDVAPHGLGIEGDAVRLTQVVSNLLSNAAKYTNREGKIAISARREDEVVVLRIRDNGHGISPEMLPNVFELFTQERQNIDRAQGGLGLGLAIVKSLVGMHSGTIEAHSAGLGSGSELCLRLPWVPRPPVPDRLWVESPMLPATAAARVLIVDDNSDAADTLGDYVRALGHLVHVAYDGPSALSAATEFDPDIGLLDIGLPVMDGYELAQRLMAMARTNSLQLVAVTGYGQPADRERALAIGFKRHVVKPIDPNELESVLLELATHLASNSPRA